MPRCPLVPARLRKAELSQGLTPEAFVDYDWMGHTLDPIQVQEMAGATLSVTE